MRRWLSLLATISFLVAIVSYMRADQNDEDARKLVGTWRLVSGKYNGQAADSGKLVVLKHVTDSQFTWLRYDKETKKISQVAGGTYSVKGQKYSEKPSYGVGEDFEQIRGNEYIFTWKIEGNKWYLNGELPNVKLKIEEVWEKLPPEAAIP
jgi:hypothetical protein